MLTGKDWKDFQSCFDTFGRAAKKLRLAFNNRARKLVNLFPQQDGDYISRFPRLSRQAIKTLIN
jgi:hypothetical protein